MSRKTLKQEAKQKMDISEFLSSVPCVNNAGTTTPQSDGGLVVKVPLNRPGWLVPPISWILPFSSHRKIRLDEIGNEVLNLCDGKTSVETIIEKFAGKNKLSFREAQLPVTKFLREMTQRGIIVIVGPQDQEKANEQ